MTPAILFLCLSAPVSSGKDMAQPFAVSQPVRLAITPVLDGKLVPEEWDPLATDESFQSFMEWEPGTVYFAAKAATGQDVVVSLDGNSDGWLIGSDNIELRVSFADGQPVMSARTVDATDPNGPKWSSATIIQESIKMAAAVTEGGWVLEASYTPPGSEAPTAGKRFGVRVDPVAAGSDVGPAYQPRNLAFVNLQFDLGQNLPSGFSWKPDFLVRSVPVDDSFKVKYGFKRTGDVQFSQVEYRAEGYAKPLMSTGTKPFPQWDKKNHVGEEYATIIAKDADVGYRVLRLTLVGKEGQETVLRSSFKIADLIDYEVKLPMKLPLDPEMRIVRGSVNLCSNGLKRIVGEFQLKVPEEWSATRGKKTVFTIYRSRGVAKVPIEFIVPKEAVGVFPLVFSTKVGDKLIEKTVYMSVGQP